MKKVIKKIIAYKLALMARLYLFRLKPEVIAITGSAGKTTTKEFLKKILEEDFNVLATSEGYNTDIGAPLALFEEKVPEKISSLWDWFLLLNKIFAKAIFSKDLPEKIVVEMGADKPGDIKYLAKIFQPKKSIVLAVLPVHISNFKNIQAIAREKSELVKCLKEDGTAYLNFDDPLVREMSKKTQAKVVFFGTDKSANFRATKIATSLAGLRFNLTAHNQEYPISATIYGQHLIYPLLAAIAVSSEENISIKKITHAIKELRPYKGRMNIIEGINGSVIIDDSYNSNPKSTIEALNFLKSQKGRRIAVLGNMNELGVYETEGHEVVGRKVVETTDYLVTVGDVAGKIIAGEASRLGLNRIKKFTDSAEAGKWLKDEIKENDVILVKGSQNKVRLERLVAEILAHPEEKMNILVRQSEFWNQNG